MSCQVFYTYFLVVQINLLEKSMIPGKKGFERIKWCFDNTLSDPFPFLISYVDSGINFNNMCFMICIVSVVF